MLKKFLNGIVFGAGFGIAFIAVVTIYYRYLFFPTIVKSIPVSNEVIETPPSIKEEKQYLGSHGIYSSGFLDNKGGVLSEGAGEIVGKAILNNKPVAGLKLRLALNGSVMSQWATSEQEGTYIVKVPYGEYQIDGFEFDTNSANAILAGKINHPQDAHSSEKFVVSEESKGQGLIFRFIDPIEKKILKNKYSINEDIVLDWHPYPGASEYKIQIYEKADPHAFSNNTIFEWSKGPRVSGTSFALKDQNVKLKAGYFYSVEIEALDGRSGVISQSHRKHNGYDFEVIE